MNARTYPRSAAQAFPQTCEYACALERPQRSLFASRTFWIGGVASVGLWTLFWMAVTR